MSQKENFTLGTHYFLKGVAKAGISFPSTKTDCVIRARNIQIRTDYDKYESLASVIKTFEPNYFENADAFVAAYVRASTKELLKEIGVY